VLTLFLDLISTYSVCGPKADTSHGHNDHMFFNCEWSGVEGDAKDRKIRHITSPCFAHRETEKKDNDLPVSISISINLRWLSNTNRANTSGRVSEVKDLIDTRAKDSPNKTNGPGAKSR
jgi:hypothetical protein